jgi:hypothetical protein
MLVLLGPACGFGVQLVGSLSGADRDLGAYRATV